MFIHFSFLRKSFLYRFFSAITTFVFLTVSVNLPTYAQGIPTQLNLPAPGILLPVSSGYEPTLIKGFALSPTNPLEFDFFVDPGDSGAAGPELQTEANKLIKYFLASLTIAENDLWVNLSPYEEGRVIPDAFGQTEMGRDLLAQDYILKQLTASMMYPEDELGEKFWNQVYEEAEQKYGTRDIPMNTFNKIWIIPESATIYINGNNVFVTDTHLKVLLEQDYLALQKNMGNKEYEDVPLTDDDMEEIGEASAAVVREVLLPAIEKEVNEGKNFSNLRQINNALTLAVWYKKNLKESLLGQVYADQDKVKGIEQDDVRDNQKIYNQYIEAFKVGVYDYIKEEYDSSSQEIVARKYFSGGFSLTSRQVTPSGTIREIPYSERIEEIRNDINSSPAIKIASVERLADSTNSITRFKVELVEDVQKGQAGISKIIQSRSSDNAMFFNKDEIQSWQKKITADKYASFSEINKYLIMFTGMIENNIRKGVGEYQDYRQYVQNIKDFLEDKTLHKESFRGFVLLEQIEDSLSELSLKEQQTGVDEVELKLRENTRQLIKSVNQWKAQKLNMLSLDFGRLDAELFKLNTNDAGKKIEKTLDLDSKINALMNLRSKLISNNQSSIESIDNVQQFYQMIKEYSATIYGEAAYRHYRSIVNPVVSHLKRLQQKQVEQIQKNGIYLADIEIFDSRSRTMRRFLGEDLDSMIASKVVDTMGAVDRIRNYANKLSTVEEEIFKEAYKNINSLKIELDKYAKEKDSQDKAMIVNRTIEDTKHSIVAGKMIIRQLETAMESGKSLGSIKTVALWNAADNKGIPIQNRKGDSQDPVYNRVQAMSQSISEYLTKLGVSNLDYFKVNKQGEAVVEIGLTLQNSSYDEKMKAGLEQLIVNTRNSNNYYQEQINQQQKDSAMLVSNNLEVEVEKVYRSLAQVTTAYDNGEIDENNVADYSKVLDRLKQEMINIAEDVIRENKTSSVQVPLLQNANNVITKLQNNFQKIRNVGGIDLNPEMLNLQIRRDNAGIPLPLPQQPLDTMNIEGFTPVIINVTPVVNFPLLLGLTDDNSDAEIGYDNPSESDLLSSLN